MTSDPPPPCSCRRCGRALSPGRGELYAVSVLAVADPYPPVFTEDDLALDVGAGIRRLVRQLSGLDAEEARDQVYRRLVFHLCTPCYEQWISDPTGSG
jgi:hypothetical protein